MSLRLKVRGSLFFFGLLAPVTAFFVLLGPSEYVALVQEGAPSWWAMVAPLGFCLLLIVEVWVLRWAVMKARGDLRHIPTIILVFSGLLSLIVASHKHDGAGFYTILALMLFFLAWFVRRRKR
jgi:hypothetical protein